jgi:pyridoxine 5'-phosphate synthase PdxJ
MINKRLILNLLAILLIAPLAWSQQERALRPVTGTVDSNIRQALVIGNSEYRHAGRLRNPVNDARAIGSTLQQLGFDVMLLVDADQRKIERAIRELGDELRSHRGVGLFYNAGHGMQINRLSVGYYSQQN